MNLTGVVSEYNPFHKGHEYQLRKAKDLSDCDGIVAVMSGNYVQRGEPAIIDKFGRAEAAICGGADLVIELPMPFSFQNAEMFADAAINELKKTHIQNLSFGCENEDVDILKNIAAIQLTAEFNTRIKKEMSSGLPYPKALSNVVVSLLGADVYSVINTPNNVLAIEYIKSSIRHGMKLNFIPVKRMGKNHNDITASGYFDSATAIRKCILSGLNSHVNSLTEKSTEALDSFYHEHGGYNSLNNYFEIIRYKISELGTDGLNNIYEVTEGLNNKIHNNVFKYDNMDDFIISLKSKRYTYSKLRRMMLNILLSISKNDIKLFMSTKHDYIKVLAFNDTGREIINFIKSRGTTVVNRYSDYSKYKINTGSTSLFHLTAKSTDIYYLAFKNKSINEEYKKNASYLNINNPL